MKCKMCKYDLSNAKKSEKIHIKNGCLCDLCFSDLPSCVKNMSEELTAKQIGEICKIVKKKYSSSWISCKNISICDYSIIVNDWEIDLKNLKKISLNFHPEEQGEEKPQSAFGLITIVLETRRPHLIIEEPFTYSELDYRILGKEISYVYPSHITQMLDGVQLLLDRGRYNTIELKERYNEGNTSSQKNDSNKSSNTNDSSKKNSNKSPFDEAKIMFGVEIPYTEAELKKIRNELIKKHHPDVGGSTETCIEINKAFDLLLRFAS